MKKRQVISFISSCFFGYLCIALSVFISIEVIMRKLFSASLQGADELGGYVLAITSVIAFGVALIGNSHIRIDLMHYKFPPKMQALLNWMANLSIMLLAILLAYASVSVLQETLSYGSTAPTPWATPLKYPQFFWSIGLALFCLLAGYYFSTATWLLVTGRWSDLRILFQPKGSADEVKEELKDLTQR